MVKRDAGPPVRMTMKYLHKSRAVFFVDSNLFGLDVLVVVVVAVLPRGFFFSIKIKKIKEIFSIKKKIKKNVHTQRANNKRTSKTHADKKFLI